MRRILPLLLCMAASTCMYAQAATRYMECRQNNINSLSELQQPPRTLNNSANFSSQVMLQGDSASTHSAELHPATIVIPVVIHVIYNTDQQNISDDQVRSQINALTQDYRRQNADKQKVPAYFAPLAADCGIEFRLANVSPAGFQTSGILRKKTNVQLFGFDDRIKSSAKGGDDAWDRNKYLNIWVGNLAGGILGYTSAPGGPAEKDGVVIHFAAFGTTGIVSAPFHLGRTATHEVGHWLNLRHIWGDSYCGDDEVDDTPKQRSSNRGAPAGKKLSCETSGNGDMYMNFMDLTDDASLFMFTHGQRERMRALFAKGAMRHQLLSSNGLSGIALAAPLPEILTPPVKSSDKISVYPNPARSVINVEISGSENTLHKLIICNAQGQPVMLHTMRNHREVLNISGLKAGVYFIKSGERKLKAVSFVKM